MIAGQNLAGEGLCYVVIMRFCRDIGFVAFTCFFWSWFDSDIEDFSQILCRYTGRPKKMVHSDFFTPRTLWQPATIREQLRTHFWVILWIVHPLVSTFVFFLTNKPQKLEDALFRQMLTFYWLLLISTGFLVSTDFLRTSNDFLLTSTDFLRTSTDSLLACHSRLLASTDSLLANTCSYWLKFETITDRATGVGSRYASASKNGWFFCPLMPMHNDAFCRQSKSELCAGVCLV